MCSPNVKLTVFLLLVNKLPESSSNYAIASILFQINSFIANVRIGPETAKAASVQPANLRCKKRVINPVGFMSRK